MARFDRLEYTDRDYDSILTFIKSRLSSVFPDWTDHELTNVGIVLVEAVAYVGDALSYYQDRQINEAFLVTATERENVIAHLQHIGYRMATATPAEVYLLFTLDKTYTENVVITANEKIKTTDGTVVFETQASLTIQAGATYGNTDTIVTLANDLKEQYEAHRIRTLDNIHGAEDTGNVVSSPDASDLASAIILLNELKADYEAHRILTANNVHDAPDTGNAVTAPDATDLQTAAALANDLKARYEAHRIKEDSVHGNPDVYDQVTIVSVGYVLAYEGQTIGPDTAGRSDGTADQAFSLSQSPFIWDSQAVSIEGIPWTRVDDFLSSSGSSQHYTVTVNADDLATLRFGDGVNGAIPPDGVAVNVSYRIGGGTDGNVDTNRLTRLNRTFTTVGGTPVKVSVTNPEAAVGGEDRESAQSGKLKGPRIFKTNERSITKSDFESNSMAVIGVARALAHTVNEDSDIPENTVYVYIVPTGGGMATMALRDEVYDYLLNDKPKTLTQRLEVYSAAYETVSIEAEIFYKKDYNPNNVKDAVRDALQVFFSPDNLDETTGAYTVEFGERIGISKLHDIMHVGGVSRVVLSTPTDDITPEANELPILGTVTLNMTVES